ncbi:M10 family metallopeptidase C-terminal domain-containing protein [Microvirga sp. ACRRW]|uniref:M10 family metallopeptidase C-terminal domain-containing protein n=1 Tax=Microvirga sp. ACRRW TaxID=2918205 RepID=UPI001EF68843|nr:M10 family metallopeptidase C-terminal domain-containing protein [Microvirga sp. ACRRW]MCG7392388.1 M10 family metallopeptidase C-terminal domain-containing protein [Microvirga sp. ACRRW]
MAGFKTIPGSGYGNALIDSLIWGGQIWNNTTGSIKVKFGTSITMDEWDKEIAPASPHGDETPFGNVNTDFRSIKDWKWRYTWWSEEIDAMAYAAGLYESVANISFELAEGYADANMVWWKTKLSGGALGAHESPDNFQESGHQRWGYFDPYATASWTEMEAGGDGLNTIIHELGHALGLAHPHDGGMRDDGTTFPGASDGGIGTLGQNQGVYTVMSYNPGHVSARGDNTYGAQYGIGALDIAALQVMYGANMTTATGNDTYELPTQNARGTGWFSIWDAAGVDTISGQKSTVSVTIDLREATLSPNDKNAGGFLSQQKGIAGGVTIANKVVIENALGGNGADKLIGNAAGNTLKGNGGNDTLEGGGGNDQLWGGKGKDAFVFNTTPNAKKDKDLIKDWNYKDDTIRLENSIFKALKKTGTLNKAYFVTGSKAIDKNDFVGYNKTTGDLWYDSNGSGKGGQVVFGNIGKNKAFFHTDLVVI